LVFTKALTKHSQAHAGSYWRIGQSFEIEAGVIERLL
jgi:hypothetical protein